jgi:hypothetical protein
LRPLRADTYDSTTLLAGLKVDTKGRVCVRQSFYSVPVGLVSRI